MRPVAALGAQRGGRQPPCPAGFPTLVSYLSSRSRARDCPRPPGAGTQVHPGGPSAGHLPSTSERWDREGEMGS